MQRKENPAIGERLGGGDGRRERGMGGMPKASVWDTRGRRRVPRTEGKEAGREGVLRWMDRKNRDWWRPTSGAMDAREEVDVILVYKRAPSMLERTPAFNQLVARFR
jgi:hypothetical protein